MIVKCKFVPDRWGLYILPLVGVSWNMNTCGLRPAFWFGWLFWLVVIGIPAKKESGSTDTQQANAENTACEAVESLCKICGGRIVQCADEQRCERCGELFRLL